MRAFAKAASAGSIEAGQRGTGPLGVVVAMLTCIAALGLLCVSASRVEAATPVDSYGYLASFGSSAGGLLSQYPHRNGVAVDEAGNIFVGREGDAVVSVYSPDGAAGGSTLMNLDL